MNFDKLTPSDRLTFIIAISLMLVLIITLSISAERRDAQVNYHSPYIVRLSHPDELALRRIEAKLDSLLIAHNWAFPVENHR